jgi:glycosyltransferase involved in cell wall biosynthesis
MTPLAPKSAVCLIAKNEGPYLLEWIAYHRALGFDEIIVYENRSTDNSAELLENVAKAGIIDHRPWLAGATESPQISAYRDALGKTTAEWILFIDADEFLVLHRHDSVNAFLAGFDDRPEVTTIGCNWRLFGDSHLSESDGRLLIDRFNHAAEVEYPGNRHLKSFTRVRGLGNIVNMHICETTGAKVHPSGATLNMTDWGLSDEIELDVAQVNHYYTKTYAEYKVKRARGYADCADDNAMKYTSYDDDRFHGGNRNEVVDNSAAKYLPQTRQEIARIEFLVKRANSPASKLMNRIRKLIRA